MRDDYERESTTFLRIQDVSNPEEMQEVGACELPGQVVDISLAGDYAYLTNAYTPREEVGMRVVDISDPTNPIEIGQFDSTMYGNGVAALAVSDILCK